MYNLLQKFFALYHHLSLPGIGNFSVEKQPAEIDFAGHQIVPAKNKIIFSKATLPAEKKFFAFVSNQLKIDELAAIRSFTNFMQQLQNDLTSKKKLYFKGIGTLSRQTEHEFSFEPDEVPSYFPTLNADRVIRKNASHTVKVGEDERTSEEMHTALHQPKQIKKEKWWIAATVLAILGIAAIVFYYTSHH